ncbi:D-alanyl-D-alanine carboxypeptidase family protein [Rhizobium sullae]|uniref:D-alanyl-D-alanine carboxypeptidase family protein n=1 Tax=Rhizobium sullae TaxID=50338 RepID=UPI000B355B83|nr:D-alanyl-D-alanine carboxypeptidase family protein [Rhizobium sullae]
MKRLVAAFLAVMFAVSAPLAAIAGNASLILDARTGKVLASENGDVLNHPASLTKMMTLYITFEALKRGKITWDTPIVMSKYAASRPPTKLGVKAGGTITIREAVYGMIVKSANDAAAAVGEKLAGSESNFARIMTQKARQLGMNRTAFYNASGLPDARQVTTARDMSTLGVALLKHYPSEYRLFSMTAFTFRGKTIRGHNNLMVRYQGMDGIKTGYTNASGFNLVSAVRDGNRRVVGVVLGGRTARSRDAQMEALLDKYLGRASSGGRLLASAGAKQPVEIASAAAGTDVSLPGVTTKSEVEAGNVPFALGYSDTAAVPLERPAALEEMVNAGKPQQSAQGWQIQISAAPSADAARALLAQAKAEGGAALKSATPYTEAFGTGANAIYRARFVGFATEKAATTACEALKKRSYDCVLLANQG